MSVVVREGNLLNSDLPVICHQLNCVTSHAKGLAKAIFSRFPYSNVYIEPGTVRIMGDILIRSPTQNAVIERIPVIIGLCAQKYPGKAKSVNIRIERERAFAKCLEKLGIWLCAHNIAEVGFPYGIGCGLAGGTWSSYFSMIESFSENFNIRVFIYKLE